jgi:hypothetical protein
MPGCGGSDESTPLAPAASPTTTATGTVVLRFAIADGARKSRNLKDPLVGAIYGSLYLSEDVGSTGPRDDAKEFASLVVENADLRTAAPSVASWTSPPLEPNKYIFTGFMDVDGNAGNEHRRPDSGDPATVPFKDKTFDIERGRETDFVENFDIVLD